MSRHATFIGTASAEYILPQRIAAGPGDSLVFRLHGWQVTTTMFGWDLIPIQPVALVVGTGIDWGSMKLNYTLNGNDMDYHNGFISPFGRTDLVFCIGKFVAGSRAIYRFHDFTSADWYNYADKTKIPGAHFTGWSFQAFIGWQN